MLPLESPPSPFIVPFIKTPLESPAATFIGMAKQHTIVRITSIYRLIMLLRTSSTSPSARLPIHRTGLCPIVFNTKQYLPLVMSALSTWFFLCVVCTCPRGNVDHQPHKC